jgi:outer membrane protein assembly factor BamB
VFGPSTRLARLFVARPFAGPVLLAALVLGLATVLVACSGDDEEAAPPTTTTAAPPTTTEAEEEEEPAEPALPPVVVRVVDGDTGERVRNAVVRIGRTRARADVRGRVSLELRKPPRRATFAVSARGYSSEKVWAAARGRRKPLVVEIYRPAYQWKMYGANLGRTQVHPKIKVRPPFRVAWKRGVGSLMEFPAVVWKGVGYVSNLQGYIHAIELDRGKVLWKRRIGTLMAASPGLVPERNELVVPTMSPGELVVLSMKNGRRKWAHPTGRAEPSPAIRDGIAYVGAANGNVYAMDLERRKPRWVYSGGVKITSSIAIVGKRLYFGDYAGRVVCLNARNGRTIWVGSAGSRVYGTVAVANGRVFAPSVFSGLSALSARTGRLLWRNSVGSYLYSSPAVYRGRVYYGTYGRVVYSASAKTGNVIWARSVPRAVSGAVQVVGGIVYAANFSNQTIGWTWRKGREVFRFGHGKYVAVSGNAGKLLVHGIRNMFALVPKRKRR